MLILHFLGKHYLLTIVLLIVCFLIAAGTAILEAYLEVRKKPKEEMFWCAKCSPKMGPFRKTHCLPLFPELMGRADNSFVCPMCFKSVVFDEPNRKLHE